MGGATIGSKISSIIICLVISIAIFAVVDLTINFLPNAEGVTIYVPTDYPTIQEAINNSKDGDTVFVYSGTYYENVIVNRTINLTGENRDATIIYGVSGDEDVVIINDDWVNITGFTITHPIPPGPGGHAALRVDSDYNTISNINASNMWAGIRLKYSRGNNITGNIMLKNGFHIIGDKLEHWNTHNIDASNTVNGKPVFYWKNRNGGTIPSGAGQVILANCTKVKVENQELRECSVSIGLGFSSYNNISGNSVSSNKFYGIFLDHSKRNNITGNIISSNYYYGVYLESSTMNDIGDNRVFSNGYAIHLHNSSNNNITDNTLSPNNGVGIHLDYSDGNYITGNNADSNTDYSIWLEFSSSNIIANNTCNWNPFDGIRIEYSNLNIIKNNSFNSNNMYGILLFGFCDKNDIIGNNASDNGIDGINVITSVENNIIGNTVHSNSRYGIHLYWYNYENYITGNNVTSNDDYGIYILESSGNKVIDNKISSTNDEGIYLWHSTYNDIINNNILSNENGIHLTVFSNNNMITLNNISSNNYNGILLDSSLNNIITDNQILSNKYDGILLESSSNNKITGNDILDNLEGVNVTSSSDNNIISGNYISNKGHGIKVSSSSYNTLTGNNVSSNNQDGLRLLSSSNWNSIIGNTVFSNNNYGFYINGSSNNSIYHNNILDNINQAYDDTNNGNQWDNGYPSGGNYWSDFDEPGEGAYDDFNGPDQNVLSGDGIVDKGFGGGGGKNPYVIDPDSQDDYPLMGPYKNYMILKQGWNLISMPSTQQEQNLTKVLASIEGLYDAVQWCDITDTKDPWKHYRPGKPYGNDLFKIKETMGFWIHIIPPGDTVFYYNGVKPAQNQKITLHPGWNMVGYPSLSNKLRTAALNNINFGSDVDSIWTHNAATQKWEEIGPSDYFEIGRGYWIHSKVTKVWDVPL